MPPPPLWGRHWVSGSIVANKVEQFKVKEPVLCCPMVYNVREDFNAAGSHRHLCQAFRQVSHQTVNNWFKGFKSRNYDIEDETRSGCPMQLNDHALLQPVESNPQSTTHEMAITLGCDQSAIIHHLHMLGKVPELGC